MSQDLLSEDILAYLQAHERKSMLRFITCGSVDDGKSTLIMVDDDRFRFEPGETAHEEMVRFRTLGCYPLSGGIRSTASDLPSIIMEMQASRTSEREGRLIDSDQAGSMEKKKQEGYF